MVQQNSRKIPKGGGAIRRDPLKDELWFSSGQVSRKPQQVPRL